MATLPRPLITIRSPLHPDGRDYAIEIGALTEARLQVLIRLARRRRLTRRRIRSVERRAREVVAVFVPDLEPAVLAALPSPALEQIMRVASAALLDAAQTIAKALVETVSDAA